LHRNFNLKILFHEGRAIAQAVSRWLPIAADRVRDRVLSCGAGAGFLRVFGFPCQSSFHQLLHNHPHLSSGACTIGPEMAAVPSGLSPTPLRKKMFYENYELA
jgi:hypothetical protein